MTLHSKDKNVFACGEVQRPVELYSAGFENVLVRGASVSV